MVDIVRIKQLCTTGKLRAFVKGGLIYLQDTENKECVVIGRHEESADSD